MAVTGAVVAAGPASQASAPEAGGRAAAAGTAAVEATGSHTFRIAWRKVARANNYLVKVAVDKGLSDRVYQYQTRGRSIDINLPPTTRTYFFRVQARNGSKVINLSKVGQFATSVPPASPAGGPQVVTGQFNTAYNITKGSLTSGESRIPLIADEIVRGGFDVVALEEFHSRGSGQLDAALPSSYEVISSTGTASLIVYNTSKLRPQGSLSVSKLPDGGRKPRYVHSQKFSVAGSNRSFLFAATHLTQGVGANWDNVRRHQTQSVVNAARSASSGLPVVVAGDFNSHRGKKHQDWPSYVMWDSGMCDTFDQVANVANWRYNSGNQLSSKPRVGGFHVDHIFASCDVPVLSASVQVRHSGGSNQTPFASDHNAIRAVIEIPS